MINMGNNSDVSDIVAHKLGLLYINSLIWKLKKCQYSLGKFGYKKNSYVVIVLKTYRHPNKIDLKEKPKISFQSKLLIIRWKILHQ